MFSRLKDWFRAHGVIILVLVLALLGSLTLVWWRLGFTLDFSQFFAAPGDAQCSDGDPCTRDVCDDFDIESRQCLSCSNPDNGTCAPGGGCVKTNTTCDADYVFQHYSNCNGERTQLCQYGCANGACKSAPASAPAPRCGDGTCNGTETCSTCATDCGACSPAACVGTITTCNGNSVFQHYSNCNGRDIRDCTASGLVCQNGACVASGPAAGNVPVGGQCVNDASCADPDGSGCEQAFCTGPLPNTCKRSTDQCVGTFVPGEFSFNITSRNLGTCNAAGSNDSGPLSLRGTVNNASADSYHFVMNVFRADEPGCAATNVQPAAGRVINQGNWPAGSSGVITFDLDQGAHPNCGRVQVDIAYTNDRTGQGTLFFGDVIDYGVSCVGFQPPSSQPPSTTQPPTTTSAPGAPVCSPASQAVQVGQSASIVATGGTGTYSWAAASGSPAAGTGSTFTTSYAVAGGYSVVVTSGTQTAQCAVTVQTTSGQPLVCSPGVQNAAIGQVVQFSASGGAGSYAWSSDGTPNVGAGPVHSTAFSTVGTHAVTVTSGTETKVCQVVVSQTATTTIVGAPGLQITKLVRNISQNSAEVDTVSANPGETVEFRIDVRSTGTLAAQAVRVRDTLPAGLTYTAGSTTVDGAAVSDGIISSNVPLGDLSPGQTRVVRFRALLAPEGFFTVGSSTLVNTAYAAANNAPEVSDTAFVVVQRIPVNAALSLQKLGRNVSRNEVGERTSVAASPNDTIEFTIRIHNVSQGQAVNVYVQDVVPQGVTYQSGTATLNGQSTSDLLASTGVNIGTLTPGAEAVVRFLGRVAPANQLPKGTTILINIARTWADNISVLQAQLPVIITSLPVTIPPVKTGPGETTTLALIISAIVTLMYIGYTSTDTFRRREAGHISGRPGGDFRA